MLWTGTPDFEKRLREFLCDPIEHTERFDATWMPVRRLVGILGNREAEKAAVVAQFCERHLLSHIVVTVRYGFTGAAIKQIKEELKTSLAVLILDHADVFALEPDDVETQRFALQLEAFAVEHAIFVVGCFDRILKHSQDTYVRHFWRPWAVAVAYLSPPHSTWIAAWLQTHLEDYVSKKAIGTIQLRITEGEYTVLAQHCVGASYGHLKDWIQRILYWAYQNVDTVVTKDLLMGPPFMYGGNRGLHIVPIDVRRDESNFSESVGQGPTVVEPSQEPSEVPACPTLMETLDQPPPSPPPSEEGDDTRVKRVKLDIPTTTSPQRKRKTLLDETGDLQCMCGDEFHEKDQLDQ